VAGYERLEQYRPRFSSVLCCQSAIILIVYGETFAIFFPVFPYKVVECYRLET
jgi:hypothetical protein